MSNEGYLRALRQDANFQAFLDSIEVFEIPAYHPQTDSAKLKTERDWIWSSGFKAGQENILAKLRGK